jgi:NAD+ diphosphatase
VTFRDELAIYDPHAYEGYDGNVIVTCGGTIVRSSPEGDLFWSYRQLKFILTSPGDELHFLGHFRGEQVFAAEITQDTLALIESETSGLRDFLGKIPDTLFQLLGRAVQITDWYLGHRFCGYCGSATQQVPKERAMGCSACGKSFYPRLSPCVMALVTRGHQCLLARHGQHRTHGFYTVLAGFIEPGENVESAIRREVREEVGLEVANPTYIASQPWPFPGQLMLGFFADYDGGEIVVDGLEIDEACWFNYDNLPQVPGEFTLSGQLIRTFVERCAAARRD